jgi:MarR family transcriptional regulator for hemolysin
MTHTSENATFGLLIRDVSRLVRRRFERKASKVGLTQAQWAVIYGIAHSEGINQATLADMLDMEPIALVGLLDKLERSKLVERRPDPSDRRARLLYLTAQARPLLKKINAIRSELKREAFAGIPPQRQEQIMSLLQQVKSNLTGIQR